MQFSEIKHRRVTIKPLNNKQELKRALKEYNRQLQVYPLNNNKIEIDKDDIYLSIYSERNKWIGLIKLKLSHNEKVGNIEISIPNPEWCMRYGTEALHQFVKWCKTSISILILEEENSIVQRYKNERPEIFFEGNRVNFNFVIL